MTATGSNPPRVSEQARHDAVRRAELAEAGLELERRTFAARLAEMQTALDQMQTAVTQARAERDHIENRWRDEHLLRKEAESARDDLAALVNGDRLRAVIEAALIAYWHLKRGKGEPDQMDLAEAGSHAFTLVDALRVAGLPTGWEPMADAHGVGDAVTAALQALAGTEAAK